MNPSLSEDQIRQIIREELSSLIKSDRYVFEKTLQLQDGRNIQLGRGTGTKIGTATDQKIGFWNTTPIAQPSSSGTTLNMTTVGGTAVTESNGFSGGYIGTTFYTIGDIVKHLKDLGILHM